MYAVSRPRACSCCLRAYFPESKEGWEAGCEGCIRMTCRSFPGLSFDLKRKQAFGPKQRGAHTGVVVMDPPPKEPLLWEQYRIHTLATFCTEALQVSSQVSETQKTASWPPRPGPKALLHPSIFLGAQITLSLMEAAGNQSLSVYSFNHVNTLAPSALACARLMS